MRRVSDPRCDFSLTKKQRSIDYDMDVEGESYLGDDLRKLRQDIDFLRTQIHLLEDGQAELRRLLKGKSSAKLRRSLDRGIHSNTITEVKE